MKSNFGLLLTLSLPLLASCGQLLQVAEAQNPQKVILQQGDPTEGAGTKAPQATRTVVFKTTTDAAGQPVELRMNVFEPAGHKQTDKTPVIVLFFGGGWVSGNPDSLSPHCAYFASRGIVAIAADYRVKNRQNTTPFESVADGKSAIRYVRAHATDLGIDPNRIVAAGTSAGGHVAACTALIPDLDEKTEDATISSVPNALVLYNPVVDTSPAGYGYGMLKDRWQEISPLQHVRPGLPPTIICHGTADKTVPYANAVAFQDAMQKAGDQCQLVTFEGAGHGLVPRFDSPTAQKAIRETDKFLMSLGYLQGEPTIPAPAN